MASSGEAPGVVDARCDVIDQRSEHALAACGELYEFGFGQCAVNAVGAEQEAVAAEVWQLLDLNLHVGLYAQCACDDVALCGEACLLLGDDALADEVEYHGVVEGAEHLAMAAQLIYAAVADVGHDGRLLADEEHGGRGTHASKLGFVGGGVDDGHVGTPHGLDDDVDGLFLGRGLGDGRRDFVDGDGRCRFSAGSASHAVAHGDEEAVGCVCVEEGVLILRASSDAALGKGDELPVVGGV